MRKVLFFLGFLFFLFLVGGLFLAFVFEVPGETRRNLDYQIAREEKKAAKVNQSLESEAASETDKDYKQARVALVIDDLGWVTSTASQFEQLSIPLTMGLLPGRPESSRLYDRWREEYEFILHMPMEPVDYPEDDPGRFALMSSMTSGKIKEILRYFLEKYPRVVGMNNHMGSSFTTKRRGMEAVMEFLAEKDLFYFDSLTSSRSVARKMARKRDVPLITNQVFLDRKQDKSAIREQFKELIEIARENGAAVGIGHIQHENTVRVLARWVPYYQKRGINFVFLSELTNLSQLHPGTESSEREIFESE